MLFWVRLWTMSLVCSVLLAASSVAGNSNADMGIVVLHGTQGRPSDKTIEPLLQTLRDAGYKTQAPEMCWSGDRIYDASYEDCLKEIDIAVAALREAGARRIVVAGQSRGGSAALIYATQHPELAGVIASAPAANPAQFARNPQIAASIALAVQMIASGSADRRAAFADSNTGRAFTVNTTARIYLSFHQVGGPADYPKVLPQLHVPVIWIAGTQDRLQDNSAALFQQIPSNPLNQYVQVDADHRGTPAAGAETILAWLAHLPQN